MADIPICDYEQALWWLLREHAGDVPPGAEQLPEVRLVADIFWHRPERVVSDMRKRWSGLFEQRRACRRHGGRPCRG